MNLRNIALAVGLILTATGGAESRDQIRIVGSSTVYPFATTVAEQFTVETIEIKFLVPARPSALL